MQKPKDVTFFKVGHVSHGFSQQTITSDFIYSDLSRWPFTSGGCNEVVKCRSCHNIQHLQESTKKWEMFIKANILLHVFII